MNQINEVKIKDSVKINLGKGFKMVILPRTEIHDSPSSSGYTEREIRPTFQVLEFRNRIVMTDYLDVIDLIEVLRGFCSNRMITEKIYHVPQNSPDLPDLQNFALTCQTRAKKGNIYLFIFRGARKTNVMLDKVECSQLAAKMSKVLNSCTYPEPLQKDA